MGVLSDVTCEAMQVSQEDYDITGKVPWYTARDPEFCNKKKSFNGNCEKTVISSSIVQSVFDNVE